MRVLDDCFVLCDVLNIIRFCWYALEHDDLILYTI